MKQKKYFLLALIFALLAAGAVYLYLESLQQETEYPLEQQYDTVLVVKMDIPARTVVTTDMLTSTEIPSWHVHPQALLEREEIVGSITRGPLFAGEQFLQQKLVSPEDTGVGLSFMISPNKRAITIAVNEVSGVGRMVLPEDRVDILVHLVEEAEGEAETPLSYVTFLLQNIKVLAIGQVVQTEYFSLEGATVTLEVAPEEAQKLSLAVEQGFIRLLLRGAADDEMITLRPFTTEDL